MTSAAAKSPASSVSLFEEVDVYIDQLFAPTDAALEATVKESIAAGMPQIQISPGQGKLLYLLTKLSGAQRVLEIGTLAGYSAIWMARALPKDGKLISLEFSPAHAEVARKNIARAGLAETIEIIVGAALDSLPKLAQESPFDLVFIDADKENYPAYLDWSLRLTHPGSLLLADNVVRAGAVLDPSKGNAMAKGAAAFNDALARNPRLEAIVLQQVGIRGHDGLALARVKDDGASS